MIQGRRSATPATEAGGFDQLLLALDPDRHRAADRYQVLRRKLVRMFAWRGCSEAEPCADETLDRVARKLAEGASVPDLLAYCHGVAVNVLREHWRQPERREVSLDAHALSHEPAVDPVRAALESEEAAFREGRLECLGACLAELAPGVREMLTRYHEGGGPAGGRRQALAREMGVPINALRIRVHRVRGSLARCIEACLGRRQVEMETPPASLTERR